MKKTFFLFTATFFYTLNLWAFTEPCDSLRQKEKQPQATFLLAKKKKSIETSVCINPVNGYKALFFNFEKPLSSRFSLIYGLGYSSSPVFNNRDEKYQVGMNWLQTSFQARYFLLPKEKKFNTFLYGGLTASFNQGNSIVYSPFINTEIGIEARYKIWKTRNGGACYFFFRLPVYQQSMFMNKRAQLNGR